MTETDVPHPTDSAMGPSKRGLDDLAIFGGPKLFDQPLHVGRPNLGDRARLMDRIAGILDRHILSNDGPLVQEFEARVARIAGARHAVAVTNATVGLQVAARGVGLVDEVIVPSFSFVATASAFEWVGVRPVFCDIDPETLTIDPVMAEGLIGPRTSGIVGVHLWGQVCDVGALDGIAARHGIHVVYDAAHAFGCRYGDRMAGTFGEAEVFSFHATKFVNSFEGGAITTDSDELAERLRLLINFGFAGWDETRLAGTNAKMHEASAAMGLTSLDAMDGIVRINRRNAARYASGLAGIDGIRLIGQDVHATGNAQHVVIRIGPRETGLTRDALQAVLMAENVLARRYFHPGIHRLEPYASQPHAPLPRTERIASEVLVLPTGLAMTSGRIDALCELIGFALARGAEVERRLAHRSDVGVTPNPTGERA
jgi:dTDP-4-amino-4,6-dideoxygalactose transaminase